MHRTGNKPDRPEGVAYNCPGAKREDTRKPWALAVMASPCGAVLTIGVLTVFGRRDSGSLDTANCVTHNEDPHPKTVRSTTESIRWSPHCGFLDSTSSTARRTSQHSYYPRDPDLFTGCICPSPLEDQMYEARGL